MKLIITRYGLPMTFGASLLFLLLYILPLIQQKISKCNHGVSRYELVSLEKSTFFQIHDDYNLGSNSNCSISRRKTIDLKMLYPSMIPAANYAYWENKPQSSDLFKVEIRAGDSAYKFRHRDKFILPSEVSTEFEERHNGLLFLGYSQRATEYEPGRRFMRRADGKVIESRGPGFWFVPSDPEDTNVSYLHCSYDGSLMPKKGSCGVYSTLNSYVRIKYRLSVSKLDKWKFVDTLINDALSNMIIPDNENLSSVLEKN